MKYLLKKVIGLFIFFLTCFLVILTFPFFTLWRKKKGINPRDTSWEFGRSLIFKKGIKYWEHQLLDFQLEISGKDVLEVGSGNGQWLIALDELGASSIQGVEPSKEIREYSLEKISQFNKKANIEVYDSTAEALPFADNSFDILLCLGVFMFTNQVVALKEFNRVLRPGGKIIITVNGLGYFLMKAKDGLLFSQFPEVRYGISGVVWSLVKWISNLQFGTCAVNINEMSQKFNTTNFLFEKVWIYRSMNLYPFEHFLFPTNYAFKAIKK